MDRISYAAGVFEPTEIRQLWAGAQRLYQFPNGYGASVVSHQYSYGGDEGLSELAVMHNGEGPVYDTPITEDVIGWLTEDDVQSILGLIAALPPQPHPTGGAS